MLLEQTGQSNIDFLKDYSIVFTRPAVRATTSYRAALYLRLSREDNSSSESMSIQSQKAMLISYAKEKGYHIEDIYIDDGLTGTNFERPEFQRMIQDIKDGRINMVITKDLSRLGRNYIVTGQYTDYFFPEYNVRYIAIDDGYDSQAESNEIAPFKNILNEMYAADISKKIRSARKVAAKQGKFMGSMPPYGYKRSQEDKHKLVIDESAANTVKRIFEMFKNHESARCIAETLNNEKVLTPQNYYYNMIGEPNPYKNNAKTWCSSTILSMLKKEVYLGHMIQGKKAVVSFKTKKTINQPPELWKIVRDTHEAIIDDATWTAVQLLLHKNKNRNPKKTKQGKISLFSGLLKCMDCGSALTFNTSTSSGGIPYQFYRCSRYIQHGSHSCTPHRIDEDVLSDAVLKDIKKNAALAKIDKESFLKSLHRKGLREREVTTYGLNKKINVTKSRIQEIEQLMQKAFEKNCNGILTDTMFKSLTEKYDKDLVTLKMELNDLEMELLNLRSSTWDIKSEIANLEQYATINKLDRTVLTSLIDSIHISQPAKVNGEKVYDIEINYKFSNASMNQEVVQIEGV